MLELTLILIICIILLKHSLVGGIEEEVVEEYKTTKERYEFLTTQLTDLRKATDDLEGLVGELDEIMKKTRDKAFKQIKKELSTQIDNFLLTKKLGYVERFRWDDDD